MPYLHRRIEYLLNLLKEGKLYFPNDLDGKEKENLENDFKRIKYNDTGNIDIESCSQRVRNLAKLAYSLKSIEEDKEPLYDKLENNKVEDKLLKTQQDLFLILDDFFKRLTGKAYNKFATPETFSEEIKGNVEKIAKKGEKEFQKVFTELQKYYKSNKTNIFTLSRNLGGLKLVLGGTQRFLFPALNATKSMLLYADTILIPDPILPWIEQDRQEERFRHVNMIQAIFHILHLKPLIDAELSFPSIVVFPSWDRSLENYDEFTQDGIGRLIIEFFSKFLKQVFDDEYEIIDYVRSNGETFLSCVEQNKLFIPPGGSFNMPIKDALQLYRNSMLEWRSSDFVDEMKSLTDSEIVLQGIIERLGPQFHLRENSTQLYAHPLFSLEVYSHYFNLCTEINRTSLIENSHLNPKTISTLNAINKEQFRWLGNVPIHDLVILRKENENLEFRNILRQFTSALNEASLEDLDQVAATVGRGIMSLLQDHQNKIYTILEKYQKKHIQTAVMSWVTLGANLFFWLAPFVEAFPPLALASKYIFNKIDERKEMKKASRSLTGVLAASHKKID